MSKDKKIKFVKLVHETGNYTDAYVEVFKPSTTKRTSLYTMASRLWKSEEIQALSEEIMGSKVDAVADELGIDENFALKEMLEHYEWVVDNMSPSLAGERRKALESIERMVIHLQGRGETVEDRLDIFFDRLDEDIRKKKQLRLVKK